jgi:hypothetical protein
VKIGRWILLVLILTGAGIYGWKRYASVTAVAVASTESAAASMVPAGVRIKVEVLNATTVKGLARKATLFLRDRGFDVVAVGTAEKQLASTIVLSRSSHTDWANLVARAFNAPMEIRPDSSRYLDVTVLVGADWRPPALPFYP